MGSIKYVPPDVAQADGCADASEEERDPVAPGLSVFIFPHVVKFFKSQNPEILFCVESGNSREECRMGRCDGGRRALL